MRPITNNTEFIIGIDFGHGETSACFYNLQNQEQYDIDILPGQKVIKSAVAILRQEGVETICVGDSAIQKAPMAIDFQVSFKKRPSEMKPDERKRMVSFMKGVYEGILDRHPDYKTRDHRVFIGRPSQDKIWKNEEDAYIAIAEEAGLPVAGIQKESRAAYFRARTQPDSKIDKQVENGVLIVDFGSSTVDFTYLNKNLSQPIDDGANIGANAVEASLLKYALSHPQDATMLEFARIYGSETKSNAYNHLLFKFRAAKEEFYGKKLPNFSIAFDYSLITSAEKQQLIGFGGITLTKQEIRNILESEEYGKYIPTVEAVVKKFKDEKLKKQKVACVYLTGGASRMDFVREIFMKVFNLKAEQCPSDDNPSLIVSQGIAHLSYADYKTLGKEKELREKAKKIIDSFDWNGKIKKIIFSSVKQSIIDKAKSIMISYKNGEIFDIHLVNNGVENGVIYGYGLYLSKDNDNGYWSNDIVDEGYIKYRNMEALIKRIYIVFDGFKKCNFGSACEEMIKTHILSSLYAELKTAFAEFGYDSHDSKNLIVDGLSAQLSSEGADSLTRKFTDEGDGHIIYDAVKSCYPLGVMVGFNKQKDRLDEDRKQHYNFYINHYSSIYSSNDWDSFLNDNLNISGISTIKKQVKEFVENVITEYISYAKLAVFFK